MTPLDPKKKYMSTVPSGLSPIAPFGAMSKPKQVANPVVSENVGATALIPTVTKPATSPARSQYASSIPTSTVGQSVPTVDVTTLQNPNREPTQPSDPNDGYKRAFSQYLASLNPSTEETAATDYLNKISTQNRLDYEKALQSGETLNYATGLAGQQARNAAIQEGGAASTVQALTDRRNAMTDAQKARMEFEKSLIPEKEKTPEGFSLSEGQARYDAKGNLVAQRGKTYAPTVGGSGSYQGVGGSGISSDAQNILQQLNMGANLDDLIKGNSISAQNLRNEVLGALNEQGGLTSRQQELFVEAKNAVDRLLSGGYKSLGGYSTLLGGKFTTGYGDAKAQAQQLQAILARDNLGLLKGAMSDKDLAFIQSMSSGFEGEGIQSEAFIKERLEEIKRKVENKIPNARSRTLSSPDGDVFDASDLTEEEYQEAVNDGYIPQ